MPGALAPEIPTSSTFDVELEPDPDDPEGENSGWDEDDEFDFLKD